jgi:hypothetical protein
MAYQDVVIPRFYVNILEYLGATGYTEIEDVYRTNPSSKKDVVSAISTSVPEGIFTEKSFAAFLGHSRGQLNFGVSYTTDISVNARISNTIGTGNSLDPAYKGFSIASFNGENTSSISTYHQNKIGSIAVGTYYDMPHSPDLNLKLSYEYDGVKTIQTKNGSTLSNAMYTKPADWGSAGAWQLGTNILPTNLRSGRRVWDLSFSYLSDTDVFPVNANQSHAAYSNNGYHNTQAVGTSVASNNPTTGFADINVDSEDGGIAGQFSSNILDGQDFFSQVWNRTLGNTLPFIFNPNGGGDSPNNSPDQFAICKFAGDILQYEQVSHNVYNITLKIEEVW